MLPNQSVNAARSSSSRSTHLFPLGALAKRHAETPAEHFLRYLGRRVIHLEELREKLSSLYQHTDELTREKGLLTHVAKGASAITLPAGAAELFNELPRDALAAAFKRRASYVRSIVSKIEAATRSEFSQSAAALHSAEEAVEAELSIGGTGFRGKAVGDRRQNLLQGLAAEIREVHSLLPGLQNAAVTSPETSYWMTAINADPDVPSSTRRELLRALLRSEIGQSTARPPEKLTWGDNKTYLLSPAEQAAVREVYLSDIKQIEAPLKRFASLSGCTLDTARSVTSGMDEETLHEINDALRRFQEESRELPNPVSARCLFSLYPDATPLELQRALALLPQFLAAVGPLSKAPVFNPESTAAFCAGSIVELAEVTATLQREAREAREGLDRLKFVALDALETTIARRISAASEAPSDSLAAAQLIVRGFASHSRDLLIGGDGLSQEALRERAGLSSDAFEESFAWLYKARVIRRAPGPGSHYIIDPTYRLESGFSSQLLEVICRTYAVCGSVQTKTLPKVVKSAPPAPKARPIVTSPEDSETTVTLPSPETLLRPELMKPLQAIAGALSQRKEIETALLTIDQFEAAELVRARARTERAIEAHKWVEEHIDKKSIENAVRKRQRRPISDAEFTRQCLDEIRHRYVDPHQMTVAKLSYKFVLAAEALLLLRKHNEELKPIIDQRCGEEVLGNLIKCFKPLFYQRTPRLSPSLTDSKVLAIFEGNSPFIALFEDLKNLAMSPKSETA